MTEQHARPMFTMVSVNDIVRLEAKTAKAAQRLKRDGDCWLVERIDKNPFVWPDDHRPQGPLLLLRCVAHSPNLRWVALRDDPDFTIVEVINDVHR